MGALRRLSTWFVLTALAVVIGFGLAWVALGVLNWILPPFRIPEDDDTLRDYGPVFVAYLTWGVTSIVGAIVAWRLVRSSPR